MVNDGNCAITTMLKPMLLQIIC